MDKLKQRGVAGIVRHRGRLKYCHRLDGTWSDTQTPKRKARGGHPPWARGHLMCFNVAAGANVENRCGLLLDHSRWRLPPDAMFRLVIVVRLPDCSLFNVNRRFPDFKVQKGVPCYDC